MPAPRNALAKMAMSAILVASLAGLLVPIILAGSHDRVEVEDIAYIMAMGLDRAENGQIELTAQIAIPAHGGGGGESGSGGGMPVMLVTVSGQTLLEALRSLSQTSSKTPFWGQCRIIIFGEQLAREGLAPVLDIMSRNAQTRRLMWVMATPGLAKEILQVRPEIENLPAVLLSGLENEAERHSLAPQTSLHDFLVTVASSSEEARAAAIRIRKIVEQVKQGKAEGGDGKSGGADGSGAKDELFLDGCAIFRMDKLVGWLNGMESRGLSWLRGDAHAGVVAFADDASGIRGSAEVLRSSSVLTAKINPANLAASEFAVRVRADGRLTEYFSGPSITDKRTMDKIDELVAAHIKHEAEQALARLQGELKADALGLGELVREHLSNAAWDQARLKWPDIFPNAKVSITVDFKLRRHGMTFDRLMPNTER